MDDGIKIFFGLDVHKDSIAVASAEVGSGVDLKSDRLLGFGKARVRCAVRRRRRRGRQGIVFARVRSRAMAVRPTKGVGNGLNSLGTSQPGLVPRDQPGGRQPFLNNRDLSDVRSPCRANNRLRKNDFVTSNVTQPFNR